MATVDVLFTGYVGERVAGTVSLLQDRELIAVVDPGMVPGPESILDPLQERGFTPGDVTDVIISHHHPDHTLSVGLFPRARVHDHWATYEGDLWTSRPAEGARVSEGVSLIETPGHTPQDITTLVETDDGLVALTHLWWQQGAGMDPLATDPDALLRSRARVTDLAQLIVPGHGAPFSPDGAGR